MSWNRITLEPVLTPDEICAIDGFAATHAGEQFLPAWSGFLAEKFAFKLVLDPDIIGGFVKDSSNLPGHAGAVCRPAGEHDCALIARACYRSGIPFTVAGGRSNLTGSATPLGGVLISMSQMLTPAVAVDATAMTVRAPVGMILEDMRQAVLQQSGRRLFFPVDPTSRTDAAVGGAIACNASGFVPGENGAIRPWVEALDLLLPCGLMLRAHRGQYLSEQSRFVLVQAGEVRDWPVPAYPRPGIKNASGPFSAANGTMDLIDLVIGSEGIYGMVTGCTLKLAPRSPAYLDLFFSLPDESQALKFRDFVCRHLGGNMGRLSALEYFGVNCRKYMKHEERLFHGEHQAGIYLQAPLPAQAIETAAEQWLELLLQSDCGADENAILLLDNDRDRAIFMEARHSLPANAVEIVQRRGTYTIMTDTVVPPERFPEFLAYTHALIGGHGLDYLAFGHLGDCHLHFTLLPEQEQIILATELYDRIIARSTALGGVYSGEHGTGKRKRLDFRKCYGAAAVEEVVRSKSAVDPQFLLNRGNVVEPPPVA